MNELIIARGPALKLLAPIEESLNEVAGLVPMPIDVPLDGSVATRRDDSRCAAGFNDLDEGVAVITLVGLG